MYHVCKQRNDLTSFSMLQLKKNWILDICILQASAIKVCCTFWYIFEEGIMTVSFNEREVVKALFHKCVFESEHFYFQVKTL